MVGRTCRDLWSRVRLAWTGVQAPQSAVRRSESAVAVQFCTWPGRLTVVTDDRTAVQHSTPTNNVLPCRNGSSQSLCSVEWRRVELACGQCRFAKHTTLNTLDGSVHALSSTLSIQGPCRSVLWEQRRNVGTFDGLHITIVSAHVLQLAHQQRDLARTTREPLRLALRTRHDLHVWQNLDPQRLAQLLRAGAAHRQGEVVLERAAA